MDPKKSCIFHANWLQAAQTIKDMKLRCCFYEAVLQYALDGMKTEAPPELELALTFVYSLIDEDRRRYEKTCEKRRNAANARWEKQQKQDKTSDANRCNDMQTMQMHNLHYDTDTGTDTDTDTDTETEESKDSIIPPISPQGAKGGAGASSFEDFFGRVKAIQVPKRVMDENYTAQYVWRMAEGNPGYGLAVNKAVAAAQSREEFVQAMQNINSRFKASGDFQAVKLALAMMRCNPQQQAAVIAEAKRAAGEADLWKTLLAKVEYINNGNKVSSLAGFFKSRQK